ncbi:MAG: hypothetical protein ACKO2O_00030 [Crocinitomicaceae bacterium]
MKIISFILVFIFCNDLLSQALSKGSFSANLDYDVAIYGVVYTSKYKDNLIQQDTTASGTQMFRINANYSIFKWFSAGIDFRTGSYIEDPENAEANGNGVNIWGLNFRLYPINRNKFTWYLGTSFGGSNLEINRKYTLLISWNEKYKFNAPHFGMETGFNWYFTKNFGFNFGLGYCSQNYTMKEKYINSDRQNLTDWNNQLTATGINLNLGLSYHIGGN